MGIVFIIEKMEISTKVNGKIKSLMGQEHIIGRMVSNTQESGKMGNNKEWGSNSIRTTRNMLDSGWVDRKMAMEFFTIQMGINMTEIG